MTHGLDAVITRGSNTYGPYQHPEKLIPLFITNAIDDLPLPLYGDGLQRRDWLYVADHADGVDHVLRHGPTLARPTTSRAATEMANRDTVAPAARAPRQAVVARAQRRGPARARPSLRDGRLPKLAALGWRPRVSFDDGLAATVDWFLANEAWWRAARSGDWDAYYERQYGSRLRSDRLMRVAVTGATGASGGRWSRRSSDAPFSGPAGPIAWERREFDLDAPDGDRRACSNATGQRWSSSAAAWTDVDGCARDPEPGRRAGTPVAIRVPRRCDCAARGIDLVHVSHERGVRRASYR